MKTVVVLGVTIVGIIGVFYLAHKGYLGNKMQTYTTNITKNLPVKTTPVDSVQNTPTQGRSKDSIKSSNITPFFSPFFDNQLTSEALLQ